MPQHRQPFLHDLVSLVAAPTQAWSAPSGDIVATLAAPTAHGVLHGDRRALSEVTMRVDGEPAEPVATQVDVDGVRFTSLVRHVGAELAVSADPAVRLDRLRTAAPGVVQERVVVSSALPAAVSLTIEMTFASDLAAIEEIRMGRARPAVTLAEPGSIRLAWSGNGLDCQLDCGDAVLALTTDRTGVLARWEVEVAAYGQAEVGWHLAVNDAGGPLVAATIALPLPPLAPGTDHRLVAWLSRALADLRGLGMALREHPEDGVIAAGAPWYLTLFGRDSLLTAQLLLPVNPGIALATLRTLARLQGTTVDPQTAEQPGKIMHELRRAGFALGGMSLPPLYYGTIDATPLWIRLLHDVWRSGAPEAEVAALLDPLERALAWLVEFGDADGDGFVEYVDATGHGLANQGWKDSADSVRFADGTIAEGPVALCEVQGYAYAAAVGGADLLEAFGRSGAARYRAWAGELGDRFRSTFWCGSGDDRYPALALDGNKRPVDALTSNIGHLLGTGLLDPDGELLVARRIASPELDSGLGLRTMSESDGGYNPLSYHCGSVWPHDTAVVIDGLHRAGLGAYAAGLVEGLLRASVAFDQRMPELYSGEGRAVPYPASCRPQAWSAAAAVVVAQALGALPGEAGAGWQRGHQ